MNEYMMNGYLPLGDSVEHAFAHVVDDGRDGLTHVTDERVPLQRLHVEVIRLRRHDDERHHRQLAVLLLQQVVQAHQRLNVHVNPLHHQC